MEVLGEAVSRAPHAAALKRASTLLFRSKAAEGKLRAGGDKRSLRAEFWGLSPLLERENMLYVHDLNQET